LKILVTGAKGFIGKNLICELKNQENVEIFEFDIDTDPLLLDQYCKEANFVFHLAGINRPRDPNEFMNGNADFSSKLLETLKRHHNTCPVMLSSSIQAVLDNAYGKSKKAAEDILFEYAKETGAKVLVYRFPNVFGKWCKPNYNSAVATFCYNIARDLPIVVNDRNVVMNLVYIDDVIAELKNALYGHENNVGDFCNVPTIYTVRLGHIADLLHSFRESRENLLIPDMANDFIKKLYSTYLSYLPEDQFGYALRMNEDARGSFTEFIKTTDNSQVSVNISKPGVLKGNHWHHTKIEKFLVVSGRGIIRLRKLDNDHMIEYHVSGQKLEVIDIPPGYTHKIENLGDTNMVTIMWANERFDPENPDTYYQEV